MPLWSYGFRPFFLLASAYAVIAMTLWMAELAGWWGLPMAMAPVAWHAHELLFGFAAAGLAGFLLTAVPSWTNAPPVQGGPLILLAGLWLSGRVVMALGAEAVPLAVAAIDVVFLPAVLVVVAPEVLGSGNRRNLPVLGLVVLLVIANGLSHGAAFGLSEDWVAAGHRAAMHLFILLIALIGGRILPAFTQSWMDRARRPETPAPFGPVDQATLAIATAAAVGDTLAPGTLGAGTLLIAAGLLHLVRLSRWRGEATLKAPILVILHLGYVWLSLGTLLLGLAAWFGGVPRIAGVHALTAGAIGTMLMAVMSRASLGHTGRPLVAGPETVMAYGLITIAALARMGAAWSEAGWGIWTHLAATTWIGAFMVFFLAHLRIWLGPRAG